MQEAGGRNARALSNREFLRASNIRAKIDYDIDGNFDEVVELINRAGELNYTNSHLKTDVQIDAFREGLKDFGYHAGCVRVCDNHVDYGLAGFFQMGQTAMDRRLIHFVFSCRVMNMGIEQYVYRLLGRPEHEVQFPFLNEKNEAPDWINASSADDDLFIARDGKLVLLGGCDLLQMASYCGGDRLEFVNRADGNAKIRYDDFGFLLSDRDSLRDCAAIRKVPSWTYEDAIRFDEGLSQASLTIFSLLQAMNGSYYDVGGGVHVRLAEDVVRRTRKRNSEWFNANFRDLELDFDARVKLTTETVASLADRVPAQCKVFVVGAYTKGEFNRGVMRRRRAYNACMREFCASRPKQFSFIELDSFVTPNDVIDHLHFTRETYYALARYILRKSENLRRST